MQRRQTRDFQSGRRLRRKVREPETLDRFPRRRTCSISAMKNSPSGKCCAEGLGDPLQIQDLKGKEHQPRGVIEIHGALWIHDAVSCSGPNIGLEVFGTTFVNSEQYRGIYFTRQRLLQGKHGVNYRENTFTSHSMYLITTL